MDAMPDPLPNQFEYTLIASLLVSRLLHISTAWSSLGPVSEGDQLLDVVVPLIKLKPSGRLRSNHGTHS
jgi:hypothetical protein